MTEIKVLELGCQRCGHHWVPRKAKITFCPKCKSTLWDVPKSQKRLVTGVKGDQAKQSHLISVKPKRQKVT